MATILLVLLTAITGGALVSWIPGPENPTE